MAPIIHHMTVIRYYRDVRPWDTEVINSPSWPDVEAAVRRMDNYCYPIVWLHTKENDDDENIFSICGGEGRWALFHMMETWQYEEPGGSDKEARLWESDQGYYCREKNILTDLPKVLRIVKAFYETGSYDNLDKVQ
jgi:hypothetical protein